MALQDNSIQSAQIADGGVSGDAFADGSVTSSKLVNGAVLEGNLVAGAITTEKIADGEVDSDDLEDHDPRNDDSGLKMSNFAPQSIAINNIQQNIIETMQLSTEYIGMVAEALKGINDQCCNGGFCDRKYLDINRIVAEASIPEEYLPDGFMPEKEENSTNATDTTTTATPQSTPTRRRLSMQEYQHTCQEMGLGNAVRKSTHEEQPHYDLPG